MLIDNKFARDMYQMYEINDDWIEKKKLGWHWGIVWDLMARITEYF